MVILFFAALVVALGLAAAIRFRLVAQQRLRVSAVAADARRWYERLGAEVGSLDDDGTAAVRQALSDASERYVAAGSGLGSARTEQDFLLARRTALEGLYCARTARTALGLDPGPELPSLHDDAPLLPGPTDGGRPTAGTWGGQLAHNPLATGAAGLGIGLLAGEFLSGRSGGWGEDFDGGGDGGGLGGDW